MQRGKNVKSRREHRASWVEAGAAGVLRPRARATVPPALPGARPAPARWFCSGCSCALGRGSQRRWHCGLKALSSVPPPCALRCPAHFPWPCVAPGPPPRQTAEAQRGLKFPQPSLADPGTFKVTLSRGQDLSLVQKQTFLPD